MPVTHSSGSSNRSSESKSMSTKSNIPCLSGLFGAFFVVFICFELTESRIAEPSQLQVNSSSNSTISTSNFINSSSNSSSYANPRRTRHVWLNPGNDKSSVYSANTSRIMWDMFRQRNEGAASLPFLSPAENQPDIPDAWESNPRNNRRRKHNNRRRVQPTQDPYSNFKERPFDRSQLLSDNQMINLLGLQNFNTDFLSVNQPQDAKDFPRGKLYVPPRYQLDSSLHKMLRRFFYLATHNPGPREYAVAGQIKRRQRRLIRRFVAGYTLCPVRYSWTQQSLKVWPRWIKQGTCDSVGGSCSMPPGMTCQEDVKITLAVLRYLCMEDWTNERCGWYKHRFPVLKSCKCACPRGLSSDN